MTQQAIHTGIAKLDRYISERNKSNLPARRLLANAVFARKPQFVIIGTGRSGTTFISKHLAKAGVRVSHEQYYTVKGPYLRNPNRHVQTRGDASWLAVPFLPDSSIVAIHQVRHPYAVIDSLFRIGFFSSEHYTEHKPFVDFAKKYFTFSDDPLRSSLRWYVEWNQRCEEITDKRFRIEHLSDHVQDLERWLNLPDLGRFSTPTNLNSRAAVVDMNGLDLPSALRRYPEYPLLEEMCGRYGYTLS